MKSLKQLLDKVWAKDAMEIYYPDVEKAVREWLQQKLYPDPKKHELEFAHNVTINELLKELEK